MRVLSISGLRSANKCKMEWTDMDKHILMLLTYKAHSTSYDVYSTAISLREQLCLYCPVNPC